MTNTISFDAHVLQVGACAQPSSLCLYQCRLRSDLTPARCCLLGGCFLASPPPLFATYTSCFHAAACATCCVGAPGGEHACMHACHSALGAQYTPLPQWLQ